MAYRTYNSDGSVKSSMTSVQKKAADKADIASGRDTARGVTGAAARIDRSVTPATTIDATNIGKTTPVVLPQPAKDINYTSTVMGNNAAFGASSAAKGMIPPPAEIAQPQASKTLEDFRKQILSINDAPGDSIESIQRKSQREAGVADAQKVVSNLTNQINAITSKAQADQLSLVGQGRGVPEVIIGGQQAQVSREAAIQALPLQAQLAAAQGNLEMAQQHADTLFKIRSADAEAKTNRYNKLVDYAYDSFTKAEQAKVDEIRGQRNTNQANLVDARNFAQGIANELFKNGQARVAAQIAALPQPDSSSPSFAQDLQEYNKKVASLGGEYTGDLLAEQLKRKQIENIQSEIDKRKSEGKPVFLDVEGKVVVDRTEAQKISKELVNNDAYKAIQKSKDSLAYLKNFKEAFDKYGSTSGVFDPVKNSELKAKYNAATLQLKEFFNLGVLNGPDLSIIQGVLPNPTDTSNLRKVAQLGTYQPGTATKSGLDSMYKMVESTLDDRYKSIKTQYSAYSPQSVAGLADANRIYIQQKSFLNPSIQALVDENPNLSDEEIISIMGI